MTKNDLMNICHRGVGVETNEWVYGYFVKIGRASCRERV